VYYVAYMLACMRDGVSESVIVYICATFVASVRFFDECAFVQVRLRETIRYCLKAWFNRAYLQDCACNTGDQTLISIQACVCVC
jgi:hypothetical protein